MIRAYDENYLVHPTRVLGWMLDTAVNLFGFKAAFDTVFRLAQALRVPPKRLIEPESC